MSDEPQMGLTQRELLIELREDLKSLRTMMEGIAREQAVTVERRASMQQRASMIDARLDTHEKAILDLQRWRDEASGAIKLARWALGASLLASALLVLQIVGAIADMVSR